MKFIKVKSKTSSNRFLILTHLALLLVLPAFSVSAQKNNNSITAHGSDQILPFTANIKTALAGLSKTASASSVKFNRISMLLGAGSNSYGAAGNWDDGGGGGGDIHFSTYAKESYDWHGTGCYDVAQSYNTATSSVRFQVDAVAFEPNPGTSVARRAGFSFPNTASPHTIILSRTAPYIQLRAPLGGGEADTNVSIVGDLDQSATLKFYEKGGSEQLMGTIIMFRHSNGVFEYFASYKDKTGLRAFVTPDILVDAYLNPGWDQTLRGLAGVFPIEENLLSRSGQPYSVATVRSNLTALNQFATSWACPSGQSLFDAPEATSGQGALMSVDPNARPAAEERCQTAGVPRSAVNVFEACVFDAAAGGDQFGQALAAHASAVFTLRNQPPPPSKECETTRTKSKTPNAPKSNAASPIICSDETSDNPELINQALGEMFNDNYFR